VGSDFCAGDAGIDSHQPREGPARCALLIASSDASEGFRCGVSSDARDAVSYQLARFSLRFVDAVGISAHLASPYCE